MTHASTLPDPFPPRSSSPGPTFSGSGKPSPSRVQQTGSGASVQTPFLSTRTGDGRPHCPQVPGALSSPPASSLPDLDTVPQIRLVEGNSIHFELDSSSLLHSAAGLRGSWVRDSGRAPGHHWSRSVGSAVGRRVTLAQQLHHHPRHRPDTPSSRKRRPLGPSLRAVWHKSDIDRFYVLLKIYGANFDIISTFFPHFSRKNVLARYHYELRRDPARVGHALASRKTMDLSYFYRESGLGREAGKLVEGDAMLAKLIELAAEAADDPSLSRSGGQSKEAAEGVSGPQRTSSPHQASSTAPPTLPEHSAHASTPTPSPPPARGSASPRSTS